MKKKIHPKYYEISAICSCGNQVNIFSTINKKELYLDVCSNCHPFYTGKQRIVSRGGRIEKFNKKFLMH